MGVKQERIDAVVDALAEVRSVAGALAYWQVSGWMQQADRERYDRLFAGTYSPGEVT